MLMKNVIRIEGRLGSLSFLLSGRGRLMIRNLSFYTVSVYRIRTKGKKIATETSYFYTSLSTTTVLSIVLLLVVVRLV